MTESPFTTPPRDNRNMKRYCQLMFLCAVAYLASTIVLNKGYVEPLALRWLIAFVPSVFAAIAAWAYWRYLRETDELLRAIELRALALSFTAGFITWPMVELVETIVIDIQMNLTMLVMCLVYAVSVVRGRLATL